MRREVTLALAAVVVSTGNLAAQTCLGRPTLGTNTMGNVGAGASFFDGGKGFGGQATIGGPLFGLAAFDHYDYDNTPLSLKTVTGGVGYEVLSGGGNVSACPTLTGAYGFGLEYIDVDITVLEIAPALSVGLLTELSSLVSVASYGQAAFVYTRTTGDGGAEGESSESGASGLFRLGLSVILRDAFSVSPSVLMPTAGDTTMNVSFSVTLGGYD